MTWPTSESIPSPSKVAESLDAQIKSMKAPLRAWRDALNDSGGLDADTSFQRYSDVVSLRNAMTAAKDVAGIGSAIRTMLSQASAFDPVVEYPIAKAALDAWITWFQGSWPRTAAGNAVLPNAPALKTYAADGSLLNATITLTPGQKTTAVSNTDALLAAFN